QRLAAPLERLEACVGPLHAQIGHSRLQHRRRGRDNLPPDAVAGNGTDGVAHTLALGEMPATAVAWQTTGTAVPGGCRVARWWIRCVWCPGPDRSRRGLPCDRSR